MPDSKLWEVHFYAPAETLPASNEKFVSFEPALQYALRLKLDRPNGWHVHVHPPAHAEKREIEKLQENALYPA
jgi:hypothetical protein